MRAVAEAADDGKTMETCHEGPRRCSRARHADCRADARSARERSPGVPVELRIRVERLLTARVALVPRAARSRRRAADIAGTSKPA